MNKDELILEAFVDELEKRAGWYKNWRATVNASKKFDRVALEHYQNLVAGGKLDTGTSGRDWLEKLRTEVYNRTHNVPSIEDPTVVEYVDKITQNYHDKNSWWAKNKTKALLGGGAAAAGLVYLNSKNSDSNIPVVPTTLPQPY